VHKSYSKSSGATAFLLDSQVPGAVRWRSSGCTFVAVLPRVQLSPERVLDVACMNTGELLTSLSSALATTHLPAGGILRVPLGDLWVFAGGETSRRYAIGLTLSDKQACTHPG